MTVREGNGLRADFVKKAGQINDSLVNGSQSGYDPGADPKLGAEICRLKKKESSKNSVTSVISEKALKNIKKKWGQKGIDAFKKAMNKGMVGPEGQSGIKQLKGNPLKGKYTHEIKVKNKVYGDYRIYGYQDDDGTMIFDYFDKGLH